MIDIPTPSPELQREVMLEQLNDEFALLDNESLFISVAQTFGIQLASHIESVCASMESISTDKRVHDALNKSETIVLGMLAIATAIHTRNACCPVHAGINFVRLITTAQQLAPSLLETLEQDHDTPITHNADGSVTFVFKKSTPPGT